MRVAFVSVGDAQDVRVWSGIPHHVLKELQVQTDSVQVLSPLSRWHKYLYTPAKAWHSLRRSNLQVDRHPLALRSYALQLKSRLKGKTVDAVIAMSSIPVAMLDVDVPIFFWTDAILEGMVNYYPGSFTGMPASELSVAHRQEQNALNRCACAFYSSRWAVDTALQHYETAPGDVEVLPFGANISVDHSRGQIEGFSIQRLNAPLRLLFIGVDWDRKGGRIAAEATRMLNERGVPAILQIVGCSGPDLPYLEQVGFVDKTSAAGQQQFKLLLQKATFLLFPTRAEAAGIVFAEASAFGLPIVSTDTGGVGDYVVEGENGVLLSMEAGPEAYADAVQTLLNDAEAYKELALGGFDLYERKLNWATSVSRLLQRAAQAGKKVS